MRQIVLMLGAVCLVMACGAGMWIAARPPIEPFLVPEAIDGPHAVLCRADKPAQGHLFSYFVAAWHQDRGSGRDYDERGHCSDQRAPLVYQPVGQVL